MNGVLCNMVFRVSISLWLVSAAALMGCNAQSSETFNDEEVLSLLETLIYAESAEADEQAIELLDKNWEMGMVAPLVEIKRFNFDKKERKNLDKVINQLLQRKTGQSHITFFEWMEWLWDVDPEQKPYYFDFKSELYKHIDPKFEPYFQERSHQANIRLEEVVWGGVAQDGIPPLRDPELLNPEEATYLADSDVVFGAYINGVAKAYPKRILAWHELFVDDFGGERVAGVYCTLCGTVIAYNAKHKGKTYRLGTSGFLYRSNKLMYDKETQSLWNTIEGKPVIGPLADKGIELDLWPVVTTTWGEWKKIHPTTKVLSLNTGHERDYSEGAAYRDYFATDELLIPVPESNPTLRNKAEVLIIRADGYREDPLAISIAYFKKKKWYKGKIGTTSFIALADKTGAVRVYDSQAFAFKSYKKEVLLDDSGQQWQVSHDEVRGPNGEVLKRLPSHNLFWFAWYNTYPESRLVK